MGSSTKKFKDLHLSGTTLNLGSQTLSADASGIIVPELTIGTGTNKVKLAAKTDGTLETTGTNDSGNQAAAATYATETFVTTQVNNLVDAAPGALDTLNELAAALGDDANFSTTVTNSIANKADTSHNQAWSTITSTPTTLAGYGITDGGGSDNTVVSYSSTTSANVNDVMMLNTDGTVTPVEVTSYSRIQQYGTASLLPTSASYQYNQSNGYVTVDGFNKVYPLSLIHISEPTRPY